MQIKVWLKENEDPKYRAFSLKLLPSVSNLIGVRLPLLRKKAKELAKTEIWREFLQKAIPLRPFLRIRPEPKARNRPANGSKIFPHPAFPIMRPT